MYKTVINGNHPGLSSATAKEAVSKGVKAAKNGLSVEIYLDGQLDPKATEMLGKRVNGSVSQGSVALHNALIETAIYCKELAKVAIKRDLTNEEYTNLVGRVNLLVEAANS